MNNQQRSAMQMALRKAFNLGQKYWQQADSEYASHWKKADATKAKFEELVEETDAALREALAQPQCNPHPDAPHGFDRNASHSANRYVCECEGWEPEQAEQEPFDMDDHPPHRLCECRKCMEYFTPLPDCDAFAASGKPIAEQTNTQFMEGYRIGLAEMREKCAKVVTEHAPTCSPHWVSYVVAIRAIKFEGDTGFRPVSEMIAEHKQDPKKAAAIEKAKMRKAEQEPVAHYKDAPHTIYLQTGCDDPEDCECSFNEWGDTTWCADQIHDTDIPYIRADYAAPVSAKREWVDLTDDEIDLIEQQVYCRTTQKGRPLGVYAVELVRAVITAFKEKNT